MIFVVNFVLMMIFLYFPLEYYEKQNRVTSILIMIKDSWENSNDCIILFLFKVKLNLMQIVIVIVIVILISHEILYEIQWLC